MEKVIIISGGSDGLGKAIAKQLITTKNKVIIASDNEDKLKSIAEELSCDYLVCDVADFLDCEVLVNKVNKKYGRIDCLINCAGLWIEGKLSDNDKEYMKKVVDVNLLGTMYLTKAVVPSFMSKKSGTIINVVSHAGLYGNAERSVYVATKFGVSGFTKSMEKELAKHNVRVIGIYPGKMNTKLFEKFGVKKDMANAIEPEEIAKTIEFILCLKETTTFPEIEIKHVLG